MVFDTHKIQYFNPSKIFVNCCTRQTQNLRVTFIQFWVNVEDVGPDLYECYTIFLCLPCSYKDPTQRVSGWKATYTQQPVNIMINH